MKISPADTAFSLFVRERTGWVCERCGKVHHPGSMGLHCSHIYSRRHRTIRWDGMNAQALCFSCHQWYGGNPAESGLWIRETIGEGIIELLTEKKNSRIKVPKSEEKAIARHYKEQLKIMQDKRERGVSGRIEFESYQ